MLKNYFKGLLLTRLTGMKIFRKTFRKIPTLVWGLLACTTILVSGFCIGYLKGIQAENPGTPSFALKEENGKLKDVVGAYEELTRLYFKQGQDISVVFNKDILQNHPEEITDAFQSIGQHRDIINVQLGRIIELRRVAGLMEFSSFSSNQN